ncbi:MAG: hypothetical protein V1661_01400 [bacterium]
MAINRRRHLALDLFIIFISVFLAIILVKSGVLARALQEVSGLKYIGSFIAGIFFTSAFTTAPATAAFVELSAFNSVFVMAILGGAGALFGDLIIFRFVQNRFSSDIKYLLSLGWKQRFNFILHRRMFRWISIFLGALIIASPVPDEIGIALLGLSKMKSSRFMAVSYILNTLGILIIGLIARAVI